MSRMILTVAFSFKTYLITSKVLTSISVTIPITTEKLFTPMKPMLSNVTLFADTFSFLFD